MMTGFSVEELVEKAMSNGEIGTLRKPLPFCNFCRPSRRSRKRLEPQRGRAGRVAQRRIKF